MRDELGLDARVEERSAQLFAELQCIADVRSDMLGSPRGMGLLIGVPVKAPYEASALVAAARENGLLIGTAGGNTLRFAPPLIVTAQECSQAMRAFEVSLPAA